MIELKCKKKRLAIKRTIITTFVTAGLMAVAGSASAYTGCGVKKDGRLWCGNDYNAELRSSPSTSEPQSRVVDHLYTTYSWFTCWSEGQIHPGGNYTWYYTQGDEHGNWGWVAAAYVYTSSKFDRDPSVHGLPKCQYQFD
jgi:hypothetical protein